jgi:hypothetical protein
MCDSGRWQLRAIQPVCVSLDGIRRERGMVFEAVSVMSKLVMPALFAVAIAVAIGGCHEGVSAPDASSDPLSQYRCLGHSADGSCVSMPANCPLIVHHTMPVCPQDFTLIFTRDDTCANRRICID